MFQTLPAEAEGLTRASNLKPALLPQHRQTISSRKSVSNIYNRTQYFFLGGGGGGGVGGGGGGGGQQPIFGL